MVIAYYDSFGYWKHLTVRQQQKNYLYVPRTKLDSLLDNC